MPKGDRVVPIKPFLTGPKSETNVHNELIKRVNDHSERIPDLEQADGKIQALVIKDGVLYFAMINGTLGEEF